MTTTTEPRDTVKEEKAAAQQSFNSKGTWARWHCPSLLCISSILLSSAVVGYSYGYRALSSATPPTLHAVPESELVIVTELPVNPDLFSAAIKTTGKKVVFGKPAEPVEHPTDFEPAGSTKTDAHAALSPSSPPPSSPPPERPPSWIVDSMRAPRPLNATAASAAAARAAAAALDGGEGSYAYEVMDARPGTLLIGGDDAFGEEANYFNGAVVLLAKVCGCHPSIFGLVLTQRTNHSMADEFCPRSAAAYPAFANNSVFLGGPVGPYWSVLSPKPTRGGFPIAPGVHVVGSLGQAHADVLRGELAAEDVRFYSGYAAWPISRLEHEVAQGKWRVALPSQQLLADGLASGGLRQLLEAQLR